MKRSDSLKHIAIYVKYHHERWDGKGYPFALSGSKIPLISQIIQVADSWDAMRSNRAYKKGLTFREAVKEIKSNKGTQFSPIVADHFLEILEKRFLNKLY